MVLCVPLHPFVVGQPHRIDALHDVLRHVTSHHDVWLATAREIAELVLRPSLRRGGSLPSVGERRACNDQRNVCITRTAVTDSITSGLPTSRRAAASRSRGLAASRSRCGSPFRSSSSRSTRRRSRSVRSAGSTGLPGLLELQQQGLRPAHRHLTESCGCWIDLACVRRPQLTPSSRTYPRLIERNRSDAGRSSRTAWTWASCTTATSTAMPSAS